MSAYSLLVGLGASLAILRVVQHVPRWQAPRWANAALLTLLGSLIGARLFYVGFNWAYFSSRIFESIAFWSGGLVWFGAVIGGYVSILIQAWRWRISFGTLADGLSPMIPPLVIFSWLGSWRLGIAYGRMLPENFWLAVPSLDEYGQLAPRFPVQFAAALMMLVFAIWLEMKQTGFEKEGMRAAVMGVGMSVIMLVFTTLRVDPAPMFFGQRIDFWPAIFLLAVQLVLLMYAIFFGKQRQSNDSI